MASLGVLNGENRLKGTNVINISHEEDAFLQSGLSVMSARGGNVTAEFHGGFLNPVPVDGSPSIDEISLSEKGTKKISAGLQLLNYKNILWERFEKHEAVLEVNLEVHPDKVKGYIKNLSAYSLKDPYVLIKGRFFPLPPLKGGHQISVEIMFEKNNSTL